MKVYIIFDPAGVWELEEPVYATREAAECVIAAEKARRGSWCPGYYLEVREFDVVPGHLIVGDGRPLPGETYGRGN